MSNVRGRLSTSSVKVAGNYKVYSFVNKIVIAVCMRICNLYKVVNSGGSITYSRIWTCWITLNFKLDVFAIFCITMCL